MKTPTLLFILCYFLTSCQKDGISRTILYWKNDTEYGISFVPFQNGIVDSIRLKNLLPHAKAEIQSNTSRGKATSPSYVAEYFKDLDSVWVVWEKTYKVTHMLSGDYSSSGKYISFFDTAKNIGYIREYEKNLRHDGKHSTIYELTRHFKQEDFEFAKE